MSKQLTFSSMPEAEENKVIFSEHARQVALKKFNKHVAWEAENPDAKDYLRMRFLDETAKGGKVGGNFFVNELRRVDIPGRTKGNYARISNDSAAILIREFVNMHPKRAPFVRTNKDCIWETPEFKELIATL